MASFLPYTAAIENVTLTVLNDTAIIISWTMPPKFLDLSVDYYTVVYTQVPGQDGQVMSAMFPPSATFGVIAGLNSATNYQFQVFASVTMDYITLEGERSISIMGINSH